MATLLIHDDECGWFRVKDNGDILRLDMPRFDASGKWKLRGIRAVKCSTMFISFERIPQFLQNNPPMRFKNGKGRWRVCDLDHGTRREWGSRIISITVEQAGGNIL